MRTQPQREDRGSASIELVGLMPVVVIACLILFQGAAAVFAIQGTTDAARQAARADSLGQDPRAAAEAALPGGLEVDRLESYGPGHGIRISVRIPDLLPGPGLTVTREAVLP